MSRPLFLYHLQKIDTRLDEIHQRLEKISIILSESKEVQQAQENLNQAKQTYQSAQRNLKHAEDAVATQKIKINQSESSLYSGTIKNPKELIDLQNEIISLKKHLATLEDHQLSCMLELDETSTLLQLRTGELDQAVANASANNANLLTEQSTLLREVEKLHIQRQAGLSSIAAEDLILYDRLRQSKRGIAVTPVEERSCSACGNQLTPAEWQAARSPTQINFCNSCGRILFVG